MMTNSICQMENAVDSLNYRLEEIEESISELYDQVL